MQGWQGVQTIPRSITYDAELDELLFYPVVEVEQLRQELLYRDNVTLNQVSHIMLLSPVLYLYMTLRYILLQCDALRYTAQIRHYVVI